MAYQSVPWQHGSSQSFKKLLALSLPVLQGKSVLDVGCNTGFFCGWANFQRAALVKGIDKSPEFIEQARLWFPNCSFSCRDWKDLGPEKFDLILCLSAIHYADDQEQFINFLMERLTPDGLLVLELGIADGEEDVFVLAVRKITEDHDDLRYFPTHKKMRSMLSRHAFKYMGQSVMQAGDPNPRHVYHISHAKPLAILMMNGHYSGKSTVAGAILKPEIYKIYGEMIYHDIYDGKVSAGDAVKKHIRYVPGTSHMMPPQITQDICANNLLQELAEVYFNLAGKRDFVLEHYIPHEYRIQMAELCSKAGYFVVDIALYSAYKKTWLVKRPPYKQYEKYIEYLEELAKIDEEAYLEANPDVAEAVARGDFPSAQAHYWSIGKKEKRKLKK